MIQKREDVIRNLEDAGCDDATIDCIMNCLEHGNTDGCLKQLSEHRDCLLKDVHKGEKRIDCLDYLMYNLLKEKK